MEYGTTAQVCLRCARGSGLGLHSARSVTAATRNDVGDVADAPSHASFRHILPARANFVGDVAYLRCEPQPKVPLLNLNQGFPS
jgi:hypothetical protein